MLEIESESKTRPYVELVVEPHGGHCAAEGISGCSSGVVPTGTKGTMRVVGTSEGTTRRTLSGDIWLANCCCAIVSGCSPPESRALRCLILQDIDGWLVEVEVVDPPVEAEQTLSRRPVGAGLKGELKSAPVCGCWPPRALPESRPVSRCCSITEQQKSQNNNSATARR